MNFNGSNFSMCFVYLKRVNDELDLMDAKIKANEFVILFLLIFIINIAYVIDIVFSNQTITNLD